MYAHGHGIGGIQQALVNTLMMAAPKCFAYATLSIFG